jgi:K+-sensing histidine kinase KdpD
MAEEQRGLSVESESVEALTGRDVVEPTLATTWTQGEDHRRKAAPLRMYLGAAPGVGKTYAMLSEGRRRRDRGTDVVVGFVAKFGRQQTIAMLEGLEVVPLHSSGTAAASSRR